MNTDKNWRIGDAGFTIFGPPNGKPAPEMIATGKDRKNIRLCAAAPELLAALENAEASIELVRCLAAGQAIDTEADNMLDSLQDRIRAAIAKAKGE